MPNDYMKAVIVLLYKCYVSNKVCQNYRGISLCIIVGKVYGWTVIDGVERLSKLHINEE